MKSTCILAVFLLGTSFCLAQPVASLSLPAAYEQAKENYPLIKNRDLLARLTELKLQNLAGTRLPAIHWKGSATLQSETVQFPNEGMVPIQIDLPLYNLKTYAEAQYLLYDGGVNEAQQKLEKLQLAVDQQSLEVNMYELKALVNRYFLGALLLRGQVQLMEVTLADIASRKNTLEAGVRHGTILESEVDKLTVRELELEAGIEQASNDIRANLAVLGSLTGTELSESVELKLPELTSVTTTLPLIRPEQELFQLQKQAVLAREELISARRKPVLSAFANVGIGYPNPLNFFDNSLSPYAIGGLSFSWKIADWGQSDRDRQLLLVQSQIIDNQRETFEHNQDLLVEKFREDLNKLKNQIQRDRAIVELREKILKQIASQLEHGVITASDYLEQVNAELRARQELELHKIQLQQVKIDYLTQRGSW